MIKTNPDPSTGVKRQLRVVASAHRPVITEFQSDAIEVEERTPPRITRVTLYVVTALILTTVVWASFSTVDTIVTAQGKLITTKANLVVQPLETSIIREIPVKVGDTVERGQALATLDPTFSQADVNQLQSHFSALDAASRRLEAELNGADFAVSDPQNPDDALQAKLFEQGKEFYDKSLQNYDAQIAGLEANLASNADEEKVLTQRLEILHSIETIRRTLADKGFETRVNLLLSQDARLQVDDSLSRIRGNQADLAHRFDKVQAERQVFIDDFRRKAYQELVDTLAKRSTAEEDLKKADRRRQLIVLTAPTDSTVLEIGNRSIGSVVREAETLFVLVPRDVPLQAEVNVDGKDIGQVAVGQSVRLKFDAFPFQKYGTASGVVRVISEGSFAPEAKGDTPHHSTPLYYRILVDLTDVRLRSLPEHFQMLPGMTVTAEMKVGKRRVISYFLYPLLRGLDESIREP
jgi:hemolysin D